MSRPDSETSASASASVTNSSVVLPAGRNHPVVDLQHVEGRREVEDVDQQAEHRGGDEMPAALPQSVGQRRGHFDTDQPG